jgi:hypothetical protein
VERGHTVDWHIEAHSRQEAAAVLRRPSRLAGGRVGWESASGLHALRDEGYTRPIEPARALAAEALTLERTLSDLVNQAYSLTPAEIALMWKTAPPRMPIPSPLLSVVMSE